MSRVFATDLTGSMRGPVVRSARLGSAVGPTGLSSREKVQDDKKRDLNGVRSSRTSAPTLSWPAYQGPVFVTEVDMPVPTSQSDPATPRWRAHQLGQLDRIPLDGGASWLPVRRTLDVTAFGVNAFTAAAVDDELIEHHDETSSGAGGHEELYVVLAGHARFIVDGTPVDAPAGTLILVEPGIARSATAGEADTTVLVVGGRPGAALPASPFEHWYAAEGAYRDGDFERATEIASAGLVDWPEHPHLRYQLACYRAMADDPQDALDHLAIAAAGDPRIADWAASDSDFDSIRDDPRFPRASE